MVATMLDYTKQKSRHKVIKKSYRCPKFDGDAKQTLEIRVERKRNLKLGELGEVSFRIYKLGELGEVGFGIQIEVVWGR